jgi:L-fucose isomerase-like protein
MEFALKAGRVTFARLNRLPNGALRLAIGCGEILRAPKSFSGTSGVVRFDKPVMDVLDTVLREGLEHHVAMAYGDHTASLVVLARMLKLPVLMLT